MEKIRFIRKTLWAQVVFAETGALTALFFGSSWPVVQEITGGRHTLFGVELLLLAGLATYAALKKQFSQPLLWLLMAANLGLLVFFGTRLADPALSDLARELVVLDLAAVAALLLVQGWSLQAYRQQQTRFSAGI